MKKFLFSLNGRNLEPITARDINTAALLVANTNSDVSAKAEDYKLISAEVITCSSKREFVHGHIPRRTIQNKRHHHGHYIAIGK